MLYFTPTYEMILRHVKLNIQNLVESTKSTFQNKAVKVIRGGRYCDRATLIYSKLGILKLVDFITFEKAIFVFKYRLKAFPA